MKFILTILSFFTLLDTIACCDGSTVNVSPSDGIITKDAIFLISFNEFNYKLIDKIEEADFFLQDDKGRKIKVIFIEKNYEGNTAQILLKAKKHLKIGKEYHFVIKNLEQNATNKLFIKFISYHKWIVKEKVYTKPPIFDDIINTKVSESFDSSASGHSVGFNISWNSGNSYKECIAIVTTKKGRRFLYLINNKNWFGIYNGICGSSLFIAPNKTYTFNIQLMDFSGNISERSIDYTFETAKYKEKKIIQLEPK